MSYEYVGLEAYFWQSNQINDKISMMLLKWYLISKNKTFFKFLQSAMASAASSAGVSQPQRPNVNPLWRHSNPDSHYGFRQQPPSGSYRGRYHLPSSQTNPSDLSHYSAIPSGK